jgi:hypothetical protein
MLWTESQVIPHPVQLPAVFVGVSQPSVSGAVAALQSAKPVAHPV